MSEVQARALIEETIPSYYSSSPRAVSFVNDKYLSLAAPVIAYWVSSFAFHMLDVLQLPATEKYRLHPPQEVAKRNLVGVGRVLAMVVLQHVLQTVLGILVVEDTPHTATERTDVHVVPDVLGVYRTLEQLVGHVVTPSAQLQNILLRIAIALYWWTIPWLQFWFACFVMDAWQYALHRTMHESRWLYRTFHSHHHRLYVPYAFGALYNHPIEGLLLDTVSGALGQAASGMNNRMSAVFFTISTFKTVCDHCGYGFPWYYNPIHLLFPNNAEYHDVHHQSKGLRYNYSQPFFIHFDTVFGTRVDPEDFKLLLQGAAVHTKSKAEKEKDVTAAEATALQKQVQGQMMHRAAARTEKPAPEPVEKAASDVQSMQPKRRSPYTTATYESATLWVILIFVPMAYYCLSPLP